MRRTEGSRRARRIRGCGCLLVIAGLLAAGAAAAAPIAGRASPEAAAVEQGFAEYKAALKLRDGARAAATISSNSLAYYDRMRTLALSGTREELGRLEGTERMLVLALRLQAPPELLEQGSPEALVAYAVTNEAMTDTGVADTDLGEITARGDVARGWILVDGAPTPGVLQFVREGGRWKFDLEFAMKSSAGLIAAIAEKNGLSEDDVILELLGQGAQRKVGPEIWRPPVPK